MPSDSSVYPFTMYTISDVVHTKADPTAFVRIIHTSFSFTFFYRITMTTTLSAPGCLFSSHITLTPAPPLDIYFDLAQLIVSLLRLSIH